MTEKGRMTLENIMKTLAKLPTFFFRELMKETGFAYPHVADNDVLENIRVVVGASRRHDAVRSRPGTVIAFRSCGGGF